MLVAAAAAAALGELAEGALLLFLFSIGHTLEGYALGAGPTSHRSARGPGSPGPHECGATARSRRSRSRSWSPATPFSFEPTSGYPADGFVLTGTSSVNQAGADRREHAGRQGAGRRSGSCGAGIQRGFLPTNRLFTGTINGPGASRWVVTRDLLRLDAGGRSSPWSRKPRRRRRRRSGSRTGSSGCSSPSVLVLVVASPRRGTDPRSTVRRDLLPCHGRARWLPSPSALAIATPTAVLAAVARAGRRRSAHQRWRSTRGAGRSAGHPRSTRRER